MIRSNQRPKVPVSIAMKVAVSIQALRFKILLGSLSRGISAYFNGPMSADWIPEPPTQKVKSIQFGSQLQNMRSMQALVL